MLNIRMKLILAVALLLAHGPIAAASEAEASAHREQPGHNEGVEIAPQAARAAGIVTRPAGPGTIRETVILYGKTGADHSSVSHLRARFPGPIVEVSANLGDTVKKAQQLALIESNDSLQKYPLLAPIAGQVIEKRASRGEYSGERVLFTIANYDQLWVELQVFSGHRNQVAVGQTVVIRAGDRRVESRIASIAPGASGHPFAVARAPLDNSEGHWTTDMMVQGAVTVFEQRVPLAVVVRALQQVDGSTVVFVQQGQRYRPRPLQLGRRDGEFVEVLGGLKPGEPYVAENSYLLKADLEKSGAAHHH